MFNSLKKQIIWVLVGLVSLLLIQVFLAHSTQKQLIKDLKDTSQSIIEISLVHKIERDVIDLQRNVNVYKNTASASSMTHFSSLIANIYSNLSQFESSNSAQLEGSVDQAKIKRMRAHLKDYQDNFSSVIDGRTQRNTVFEKKIKQTFKQLITDLENNKKQRPQRTNIINNIKYHLLSAESLSYQYLIDADYELIQQFITQLNAARSLIKESKLAFAPILTVIDQVNKDFIALTQITRGYVFLVNVVMAGSSNEFLYLTKAISKQVTQNQEKTHQKILLVGKQSKSRSDIFAVFSITIALLVAIFIISRIIIPIRKVTTVFNRLSEGEDMPHIPGSHRNDEIGHLVKAANVFSEKNKQTSELLEQSQKMNDALAQLTEEAQQASRAKGEFLASMSHEIRTPMNGVMGMLGLLSRSDLNEKQQHYTNLAKTSADTLLVVINDILDFSKIEAGKLDIEILDFNIIRLFSEFIQTYAILCDEKKLELVLDVSNINTAMVQGDPGRIRQVLNNLISNAIKFTQRGGIILKAELDEDDNGLILQVKVTDTGIGIQQKNIASLFESFTQADSSTTRKYGGTGLGLAITKQLCQLMGGDISVTSKIGEGSCFKFNISLQKSDDQTSMLPKVDLTGLEILVVDDSEANRQVLKAQLSLWGAKISQANNGRQALQIIEQSVKPFSVAIIDMCMPLMDGAELGRQIRENNNYDDTQLIMMTSISLRGDAQKFSKIGYNAYLPKPTILKDLQKALMVVTDGGEALVNAKPLVTKHYLKELQTIPMNSARILLVDDNRINLELGRSLLEELGYFVDETSDGAEAIQALVNASADSPYELIFMDCQMPIMDGYEATQQIRSGNSGVPNRDIPIIAMTANAMEGDKEKCLNAGMNGYLAKPIDYDALEKIIRLWLPSGAKKNQ